MTGAPALAPAKLNLYLHVLGKRADGYHTLESLVTFTTLADTLRVGMSKELSLTVDGEFATEAGNGDGNLVLRAARMLLAETGTEHSAALALTKAIPVGAGLGGGSADAAATTRVLNDVWELKLPPDRLHALAVKLGADVAMCLASQPAIARGIGEALTPLPRPLPPLHLVLAHPRTPLLTADVFRAWDGAPRAESNAVAEWLARQDSLEAATLLAFLAQDTRNDLQRAAIAVRPEVGEVLLALETLQPAPGLVRMSGSGACCFAAYGQAADAAKAADWLRAQYPQWWVVVTQTI